MRRSLICASFAAVIASISCGSDGPQGRRYDGPPSLTIASSGARVDFDLRRFRMTIATADGRAVLATSAEDPTPDDPTKAFGEIGATHRETELRPTVIEGYDHASPT